MTAAARGIQIFVVFVTIIWLASVPAAATGLRADDEPAGTQASAKVAAVRVPLKLAAAVPVPPKLAAAIGMPVDHTGLIGGPVKVAAAVRLAPADDSASDIPSPAQGTAAIHPGAAVQSQRRLAYLGIRAELARSAVPVLLPARMPAPLGSVASVAVINASRTGYDVGFAAVPHCGGAMSCTFLHIAGYTRGSAAGRAYGGGRPVRLPDGSHGYFSPRDCSGASCTEASLTFERYHAIYEIDAKVGQGDLALLSRLYQTLTCISTPPATVHGR